MKDRNLILKNFFLLLLALQVLFFVEPSKVLSATLTFYPHLYAQLLELLLKNINNSSNYPGPFLGQLASTLEHESTRTFPPKADPPKEEKQENIKIREQESIKTPKQDNNKKIKQKEELVAIASKAPEALAAPAVSRCSYEFQATPIHQDILINEVAWMGSENSENDEWLELKNISSGKISLKNWQLVSKDNKIQIIFNDQIIERGEYFLLRKDNDVTISQFANFAYSGGIDNENDGLRLFNPECVLVDEVLANPSWPAGSTNPKRSMERVYSFDWRTYSELLNNGIFGTPKKDNSQGATPAVPAVPNGPGVPATPAIPAIPPHEEDPESPVASSSPKILISEISAGTSVSSADEFIELYNPNDVSINLTGWSLKKSLGSSTSSAIDLVSSANFIGIIAPKSFFLIAHENYRGNKLADLVYSTSSQELAYGDNTLSLHNASSSISDEIYWANISTNGSIERKALSNNVCLNAESDGRFLGNGCDTDIATDFSARALRDPQNTNSLPEPRSVVSVSAFTIAYNKPTLSLALNWATSTDASGSSSMTYILKDISSGATTTELARVGATSFLKSIKEVARDYKFSISALDRDGLEGLTTENQIAIPSLFSKIDFYYDATTTKNFLELSYGEYPFIPAIYSNNNSWKLIVFYKNTDPIEQASLDVGNGLKVSDTTNVLRTTYFNFYNGNSSYYSLALPDISPIPEMGAGVPPYAFEYTFIEDNKISTSVSSQLISTDYITAAYYDYSLASFNDSFRLVAIDKTKNYFASTSPSNLPPTTPVNLLVESYNQENNEAILSFDKSTDPDSLDRYIYYQVRVNGGSWQIPISVFPDGAEPNHSIRRHVVVTLIPNQSNLIEVRALGDREMISGVSGINY